MHRRYCLHITAGNETSHLTWFAQQAGQPSGQGMPQRPLHHQTSLQRHQQLLVMQQQQQHQLQAQQAAQMEELKRQSGDSASLKISFAWANLNTHLQPSTCLNASCLYSYGISEPPVFRFASC